MGKYMPAILNFDEELSGSLTCEKVLSFKDGDIETETAPCGDTFPEKPKFKTGESVWVKDESELPGLSDGGCHLITIVYNNTKKSFEFVHCNGVA